jgi:hypothetical protein
MSYKSYGYAWVKRALDPGLVLGEGCEVASQTAKVEQEIAYFGIIQIVFAVDCSPSLL